MCNKNLKFRYSRLCGTILLQTKAVQKPMNNEICTSIIFKNPSMTSIVVFSICVVRVRIDILDNGFEKYLVE